MSNIKYIGYGKFTSVYKIHKWYKNKEISNKMQATVKTEINKISKIIMHIEIQVTMIPPHSVTQ